MCLEDHLVVQLVQLKAVRMVEKKADMKGLLRVGMTVEQLVEKLVNLMVYYLVAHLVAE